MAQRSADWDAAKSQYPSYKFGPDEWVEFFDRRPDVMHSLLGDIYIVSKYDERKRETGKRLDGRRTMPREASLTELWDMITPKYAMDPFAVAIKELIGARSLRAFASRVPMDHRELSRMIRGEAKPSMYYLEQIAKAGRVHPAFFMEWRTEYVVTVVTTVLNARPNLSIGAVKRLKAAQE
jgi:hypothetical protein